MSKLGIDIDGVVCDILPSVVKFAHMKYRWPSNYCVEQWNPVVNGINLSSIIDEFLSHDAYVEALPVVPGAREAIASLSKKHEITFITHRTAACGDATRRWIADNVGHYPVIHADGSKAKCDVDMMVDDSLANCWDFIYACKTAILFDRPYNREPFPLRVSDWPSVLFLLDRPIASILH